MTLMIYERKIGRAKKKIKNNAIHRVLQKLIEWTTFPNLYHI